MYKGEAWLGTHEDHYMGAKRYAGNAFKVNSPLTVFVICSDSPENLLQAKAEIRNIIGIGNYAMHINDTHAETVDLAKILFNENSIHHLNFQHDNYRFVNFQKYFQEYSDFILGNRQQEDFFCVSGSSTLSAYGLRDAGDLDFIHPANTQTSLFGHPKIKSHNEHIKKISGYKADEILFDPRHHFYYQGSKFIAIPTLKKIKEQRREIKDIADLKLINKVCGNHAGKGRTTESWDALKYYRLRMDVFMQKKKTRFFRQKKRLISIVKNFLGQI